MYSQGTVKTRRHTGVVLERARLVRLLQLLLGGIWRDLSQRVSSMTLSKRLLEPAYAKDVVVFRFFDHDGGLL
jgi:hypothetical protein